MEPSNKNFFYLKMQRKTGQTYFHKNVVVLPFDGKIQSIRFCKMNQIFMYFPFSLIEQILSFSNKGV